MWVLGGKQKSKTNYHNIIIIVYKTQYLCVRTKILYDKQNNMSVIPMIS